MPLEVPGFFSGRKRNQEEEGEHLMHLPSQTIHQSQHQSIIGGLVSASLAETYHICFTNYIFLREVKKGGLCIVQFVSLFKIAPADQRKTHELTFGCKYLDELKLQGLAGGACLLPLCRHRRWSRLHHRTHA